jgi:glycosyltransferase involved in cell wall biosynthesis
LARLFGWRCLAFWGHGYNHQGIVTSLSERLKQWLAIKVDWWFAYTQDTCRYLAELGFPRNRITIIENATDTSTFAHAVANVPRRDIIDLRCQFGFPENACVALYCGSFYADKQLEFLLQVGDELYRKHVNFRMIVIGDGPQKEWMRDAAKSRSWLQYSGPQFGSNKAKLFAVSDFFLNPGAVGLAILDSFAAGLPFITSNYKGHGPEIAYLEHEGNGLMLPFDLELFVEGVDRAIEDHSFLASLRQGALVSGKRYTLENMVANVANGVMDFLSGTQHK